MPGYQFKKLISQILAGHTDVHTSTHTKYNIKYDIYQKVEKKRSRIYTRNLLP